MELIVHLPSGALLASRTSKTPLASLDVTQRNELACRVWFVQDGPDVSQPLVAATIPAPYTRLVLSARPNDSLAGETLVFFLDDFTETGEGDDLHYTGTLNTATAAAAELFTNPTRRRHACYLDLDLLVTADPEDGRQTLVKQREFFLYRAIWQGSEGVDPDAEPAYPPPSEIVTEAPEDGTLYGRKDGAWEAVPEGGGGSGDLTPYLLREESFTAVAGKAYACDTSGTVEIPAVLASFSAGGVIFTAKTFPAPSESIYISAFNGDFGVGEFYVNTEPDVTTCGEVVAAVNASLDAVFTAALAPGSNAGDIFANLDDSFSFTGGSAATEEFAPFEVTLPVPVVDGEERVVVAFCDARGTWGDNPLVVLRNGERIEGVEVDFINNAAGTFFAMVYIDDEKGWRVLASGAKPLNLTPPTIAATAAGIPASVVSTGTWTGSPASFSYQWQKRAAEEDPWMNVTGATAASMATDETDIGKFVRCLVTATNANGPSTPAASESSVALEELSILTIEGLAVWLDASNAESLRTTGGGQASSGQPVTQWRDISGNDQHAGINAGTAPVLHATDGVQFSAGSYTLGAIDFTTGGGGSIFVVSRGTESGTPKVGGLYNIGGNPGSGNHFGYYGSYYDSFAGTNRHSFTLDYQTDLHVYSAVSAPGAWSAWKNDTPVWSTASNSVSSAEDAYLGAAEAANYWFQGFIQEVLIFTRPLTEGEREVVTDYLMAKWGI